MVDSVVSRVVCVGGRLARRDRKRSLYHQDVNDKQVRTSKISPGIRNVYLAFNLFRDLLFLLFFRHSKDLSPFFELLPARLDPIAYCTCISPFRQCHELMPPYIYLKQLGLAERTRRVPPHALRVPTLRVSFSIRLEIVVKLEIKNKTVAGLTPKRETGDGGGTKSEHERTSLLVTSSLISLSISDTTFESDSWLSSMQDCNVTSLRQDQLGARAIEQTW